MADLGMTGGGRLEAHLRKIAEKVRSTQEVRVGFPEGQIASDGSSMPLRAVINEFGAPSRGQPPRPFFRRMIAKHKDEWGDQLGKELVKYDYDPTKALKAQGDVIAGELRQSIVDLIDPPLAASTAARKGSTKPLILTGEMLGAVEVEVTEPQ